MSRSMILTLTFLAVTGSAASAYAATEAEQEACRSDAIKYCSAHIGKPSEMGLCLEQHKDQLTDACRKVVESHGG